MKREKVKVIVVTYNSVDCIFACLKSLERASENFDLYITVVDNASADATLDSIITGQSKANIEIISNSENLGYAYGNNIAIEAMFSEELQYAAVLILNPDVILDFGAIDKLLLVLCLSEEVGAVSPNVIEPGQSPNCHVRINSLWGQPMKKRFMKHENTIEVDRLHGGCMLVKPNLFKKIGAFDESYFLYWEEIDLCQRARKAGYKLLQCYDVVANHAGDSKSGRYRSHRIYYMWRNQFYFAFKSFWIPLACLFLMRKILSNFKEAVGYLGMKRFDLIYAGVAGWKAGILGEVGQGESLYAKPVRVECDEKNSGQ